jgi:copper chaperone CopZ
MTCEGCSGAVKRILGKIEGILHSHKYFHCVTILGVSSIDANMETNVVTVICQENINEQDLLAALQKWGTASGKSVALIEQ